MLFGSWSAAKAEPLERPVASTRATGFDSTAWGFPADLAPSTGAPAAGFSGSVAQAPRSARLAAANEIRIARMSSLLCHSMNGPQAGSRTSPAVVLHPRVNRAAAGPPASTPPPFVSVGGRALRALGANLGGSAPRPAVEDCA